MSRRVPLGPSVTPASLLDLSKEPRRERLVPEILPWLREAGNPYFDWIFGGETEANAILGDWVGRPSSEVSLHRIRVLLEGDRVAGGIISLSPTELTACRKADMMALLQQADRLGGRAALFERLRAVRNLFPPLGEDVFYLSKLWVSPHFRGRGYGRRLFEAQLDHGRSAGFRCFRLDVASDNSPAIALYASAGFETRTRSVSADGSIEYLAMAKEEAA